MQSITVEAGRPESLPPSRIRSTLPPNPERPPPPARVGATGGIGRGRRQRAARPEQLQRHGVIRHTQPDCLPRLTISGTRAASHDQRQRPRPERLRQPAHLSVRARQPAPPRRDRRLGWEAPSPDRAPWRRRSARRRAPRRLAPLRRRPCRWGTQPIRPWPGLPAQAAMALGSSALRMRGAVIRLLELHAQHTIVPGQILHKPGVLRRAGRSNGLSCRSRLSRADLEQYGRGDGPAPAELTEKPPQEDQPIGSPLERQARLDAASKTPLHRRHTGDSPNDRLAQLRALTQGPDTGSRCGPAPDDGRAFKRATRSASRETSLASTRRTGSSSASVMARQPDPVPRSIRRVASERRRGTFSALSTRSSVSGRGISTAGVTPKRRP